MFIVIIVGLPSHVHPLLCEAIARGQLGLRPHTLYQYKKQFNLFLAFVISHDICTLDCVSTIIVFLEFLTANALSFRVVMNYVSALKYMFAKYAWSIEVFEQPIVKRMLKGINYTVRSQPSPKGLFTLMQIREISRLCDVFESSLMYRAAFLLVFFGLLRISNIAPPSPKAFDKERHFLRRDVTFAFPGTHMRLKWAKNIQAPERIHLVKLPCVDDPLMCPTQTLRLLLNKRILQPDDPLLVLDDFTLLSQRLLRRRLATLLRTMGLPLQGYGFHSFRRSGATLACDSNVSLSSIKMHGVWNSDAVWSYISDNTSQSLQVPLTFQSLVNSLP